MKKCKRFYTILGAITCTFTGSKIGYAIGVELTETDTINSFLVFCVIGFALSGLVWGYHLGKDLDSHEDE